MSLTISVAELMHQVKGSSSHYVRQVLQTQLPFKWQDHYGVVSVSPYGLDSVAQYIHHQPQHHANDTLHPLLEQIPSTIPL